METLGYTEWPKRAGIEGMGQGGLYLRIRQLEFLCDCMRELPRPEERGEEEQAAMDWRYSGGAGCRARSADARAAR